METWTITNIGPRTWKATRAFGPYTVAVGHGAYGGSWRIITATAILMQVDQLPTKSIEEAISVATSQISALIDALTPFSALAAEVATAHAEAAHADEVIASTRALLNAAHAALARQAARIAVLEAKADADADSRRWNVEMCVWGPWDADREEGGQ